MTGPAAPAGGGGAPLRWWRRVTSRIPWLRRVPVFLVVGATSSAAYVLLYLALRAGLDPQPANAVALVSSTLYGTAVHRRFTFDVRGRERILAHQGLGLVVLGAGLAITSGSLWLLARLEPDAGRVTELLVLGAANGLAGAVRFGSFLAVMRPEEVRLPARPRAGVGGGF